MKAQYFKNRKGDTDSTLRVIQLGSKFQAQRLGSEKGTREQSPWIDCSERKDTVGEAMLVCSYQQSKV